MSSPDVLVKEVVSSDNDSGANIVIGVESDVTKGLRNIVIGRNNKIIGNGNLTVGNGNIINANNCFIMASNCDIKEDNTVIIDFTINSSYCESMKYNIDILRCILTRMITHDPVSFQGAYNTNDGNDNFVIGSHIKVVGNNNFIIGHGPLEVVGNNNFALFVQVPSTINGSDHVIIPTSSRATDVAQLKLYIITTAIDSLSQ